MTIIEFMHNLIKALLGSKTVETDKYDDSDICPDRQNNA